MRPRSLLAFAAAALALAGSPTAQDVATAVADTPTTTLLVLNKSAASVSFVDPASGTELGTAPVGDGPHEVAVSPDGRTAVVTNYGGRLPGHTLTVLDVVQRTAVKTIELTVVAEKSGEPRKLQRPHGIQYFHDGRRVLVTCEQQRTVAVVDVAQGGVTAILPTQQGISHMVVMNREETRAFVANIRSGSVSVLDLEAGELLQIVETGDGAEGIALRPGSDELWVTNRAADTLTVLDTRSLETLATIPCGEFPIRVAFTPDGAHALVSNARSGAVAVVDAAERRIVRTIAMDAEALDDTEGRLFAGTFGRSPVPVGILVEPDGKRAFVANTQADLVTVLDLETWRIASRWKIGKEPDGMGWAVVR